MKKFTRYSALALLSTTLATGVNAALTDDINLTGTIAPSISIDVPDASTAVTMTNGTVTSQNLTVASNVDFTITVGSANTLKMNKGSGGNLVSVDYGFTLKDAGATTLLSTLSTSATLDPVDATWTFNVTPTGIDGSTEAGTYTDTITLTVAAI
jgi:hypothetical protein